ncbi:unnamed protein product [Strongylus vulgaris]|uniref:Uncharacterized protein n=1 Tax=Strongylus vulgaris TaxID=40348 RepID=A0A3P7IZ78_STRVU|nr:unnamed protein product [Strongylus vulgaris]
MWSIKLKAQPAVCWDAVRERECRVVAGLTSSLMTPFIYAFCYVCVADAPPAIAAQCQIRCAANALRKRKLNGQ